MGYRSAVKIAVKDTSTDIIDQLRSVNKQYQYMLSESSEGRNVVFSHGWIRWDEHFHDGVKAMMAIVDAHPDEVDYIRVGEECNDVDVRNPLGILSLRIVVD